MRAGGLVRDALIVDLVQWRLDDVAPSAGVLFDGFPRTIATAAPARRLRRAGRPVRRDRGGDRRRGRGSLIA
jgi:adenylate kinase family enzyme